MLFTKSNHLKDKHTSTYAAAEQQTQYSQKNQKTDEPPLHYCFSFTVSLSLPSHMLSFPCLPLCPTLSSPSVSFLTPYPSLPPTTLSLFLVFLMAEYPLIPNPDADFRL